eukprot:scaffold4429_cov81-Skeletonema_dohrnii-CCMP3373.AAC.1
MTLFFVNNFTLNLLHASELRHVAQVVRLIKSLALLNASASSSDILVLVHTALGPRPTMPKESLRLCPTPSGSYPPLLSARGESGLGFLGGEGG